MAYTDILISSDKISNNILILDKNGEIVKNILTYNNKTKEAVIYNKEKQCTEEVVLTDSRIVFRSKIIFD